MASSEAGRIRVLGFSVRGKVQIEAWNDSLVPSGIPHLVTAGNVHVSEIVEVFEIRFAEIRLFREVQIFAAEAVEHFLP